MLTWGAVLVGVQVLAFALFAPFYLAVYAAMFQGVASGAGPLPVEALQSPQVRAMQGMTQIYNLGQLLVTAVLYCAVFRAVLHPERASFAYLRVGAPELFMVLLIFAAFIALFVGLLIVLIPVSIIIGVTVAVSHGGGVGLLILLPLVMLALMSAFLFVALRFVFVGPMIVEDGKFHLFESWTLTRGRMGNLFLIGLSLVGIFLLFNIVILAVLFGLGAAAVQSLGGLNQTVALMRGSPAALVGKLAPLLVAYVVLQIPIAGCLMAIGAAPWAKAYRDLLPDASHVFA